jgi:hypothetical protein
MAGTRQQQHGEWHSYTVNFYHGLFGGCMVDLSQQQLHRTVRAAHKPGRRPPTSTINSGTKRFNFIFFLAEMVLRTRSCWDSMSGTLAVRIQRVPGKSPVPYSEVLLFTRQNIFPQAIAATQSASCGRNDMGRPRLLRHREKRTNYAARAGAVAGLTLSHIRPRAHAHTSFTDN